MPTTLLSAASMVRKAVCFERRQRILVQAEAEPAFPCHALIQRCIAGRCYPLLQTKPRHDDDPAYYGSGSAYGPGWVASGGATTDPPIPEGHAAARTLCKGPPGQKLTPEAQLLSPEDFAARRKLGAFITCLNGVTGIIPKLARPYRDAFRAVSKDPVNGLDRTSYTWMYQSKFLFHGPETMGHPPTQECADRLTAVVAQPLADEPLDTLSTAYAADLRKLDVLAPKVEAYYNGKDFRDDGMAQGREMNAEYDPLLQRLLAEGHEMFVLTRAREAVLQQRRLDGIERLDGKQLRWQANAFMVQARTTLDGLQALVAAKKVTKPAVLGLVTPLEVRFAEASDYAAAHPEENNDDMNLWAKIADHSYAADLMTAAKQARRDADNPGSTGKVSDDAERMAYCFRNMLDYTNSSKR